MARVLRSLTWKAEGCCAIVAGALLLGGCVRFHLEPLSPAETAQAFEARTLDNPGLRSYIETTTGQPLSAWPPVSWDVTTLTLAAFYYQPDLDVARARWAVARAGRRTAGEHTNPTLNLTPGYDTTTSVPSPWLPLGLLDIPIETAGKRGHRKAQAEHLAEAERLSLASTAWRVRSRVRSSLVELEAARAMASLLEEQETLQGQIAELMKKQAEAGEVSGYDVRQSQIAADQARLARSEAEGRKTQARVALAEAVGVPPVAIEHVQIAFEGLDALPDGPSLAEARQQAVLSRSDVLGALAEYAASQSALQLEIARQYPDLSIGPGYQYDQGDDKWSLGITFTLPIFNRNRGPIAEAQARRREAAARFEALQAQVLAEVERAVAGYDAARHQQADAEALQAKLVEQEAGARAMLDAGEIGRSELLGQELQLNLARQSRTEALTRAQQSLAALEEALQRPLGVSAAAWEQAPRVAAGSHREATP